MELIFYKDDLLQATRLLQSVAGRATEMPILSYILIDAQKDKIQMVATNLEILIKMQVNGTIVESGSIAIPARKLFDIAKELPPSVLKLTKTVNERAQIECEHGRYTIIGLPVEQFPQLAEMPNQSFTFNTAELKYALSKTAFAASREETRSSLNGVFFHFKKSATTLVAADGKKLALVEIPKVEIYEEIGLIVPIKAVGEIQKLFFEENVKVSIAENQIFFADNYSLLSALLIEGEFPNYNSIIPKDNELNFHFDTQKLVSALRRVSVLANSETRRVIFEIQDGLLKLSAYDKDFGDAYEEMEIEAWDENITIAFDSKSVIEILSHIDSEVVVFNLKGPFSPAIIKPNLNESYFFLIAPMRLS
jgi:DNA polymerase-3 subunit beta